MRKNWRSPRLLLLGVAFLLAAAALAQVLTPNPPVGESCVVSAGMYSDRIYWRWIDKVTIACNQETGLFEVIPPAGLAPDGPTYESQLPPCTGALEGRIRYLKADVGHVAGRLVLCAGRKDGTGLEWVSSEDRLLGLDSAPVDEE